MFTTIMDFINQAGTLTISIISFVSAVLGIASFIISKSKDNEGRSGLSIFVSLVLILISIFGVISIVMNSFYIEVPETKSSKYDTAKQTLIEKGFVVEQKGTKGLDDIVIKVTDHNGKVIDKYLKKGSVIYLTTEEAFNKVESIPENEKKFTLRFQVTAVDFYCMNHLGNNKMTAFTDNINELVSDKGSISLINEKYNVKYDSFKREKVTLNQDKNAPEIVRDYLVFEDIPLGDYLLQINIDGYVPMKKEISFQPSNVENGFLNYSMALEANDTSTFYSFNMQFLDENLNPISKADCSFWRDGDSIKLGAETLDDGFCMYDFLGEKGNGFNVEIYYNQKTYKGSFKIREDAENIKFIIQNDGTLKRSSAAEIYNY